MKTSIEFILLVLFIITLFMGGISYLSYQRQRSKELGHLSEFWASLAASVLVYYIFRSGTPTMIALSMVGWLWPMKTFKYVLQDMASQEVTMERWEYILLAVGGFVSLALGGYGYSFLYTCLPLALAVGVVGLHLTLRIYRSTQEHLLTPLIRISFYLMGLLFIERISFPLWRLNDDINLYGLLLGLIILIGFAGTTLAAHMELMRNRQDQLMKEMLKERNEKLLSSSKYSELGMMSAGIAHEINNPLAVIQARTTQLLRVYRNPEKQKDLADGLQQILYTSERINRTIQGVREFVHQDEKGPVTEISLKDLVDDVLAFTGQRMKNHGVNLRFYGLENFSVVGNKIQLEQIILNLLNNSFDAIEFLPDKWIEVSVHQSDGKIQIYFKDSGTGIPPETASRIMEPFYTTKDLGKGTGLGLALARGIAEKHGGKLEYLSHCPHTTFMLELPKNLHREWGSPLH
jgi:signal transduction histidine kinase